MFAKVITSDGKFETVINCTKVFSNWEVWETEHRVFLSIEMEDKNVEWILGPGDRLYLLNNFGKTIDSYLVPVID